tara:strand:- start:1760 stop:3190 length:1431 start_codon:yes stop_codon:yes gene_type:complete
MRTDFSKSKILCIGDVILDSYVIGDVDRISPEAPIPIFKFGSERFVLGGAANVARNIISGGAKCTLLSVIGKDQAGKTIRKLIGTHKKLTPKLVEDASRITTKKTRFMSGQQQILRVDEEKKNEISNTIEKKVFSTFKQIINDFDIVVISDYDKGILTSNILQKIINFCNSRDKTTIIDPKKKNFFLYSNASIITPNFKELLSASDVLQENQVSENKLVEKLSKNLIKKFNFKAVLTTRSSSGMSLISTKDETFHLSSRALEVYDVSGAGDTVAAYLSLALTKGMKLKEACEIANTAAGVAVGKLGTASVNYEEVFRESTTQSKLYNLEDAKKKILRLNIKKIGFTNGCFDILHSGHLNYLKEAKRNCDFLILGLNSDSSISKLKGKGRPIINLNERILMLSNFSFINMIIVFNDLTPLKLIKSLKPKIIFKGRDYKLKDVVGFEESRSWNGKVMLINYEKGKSTSNLIKKIKDGT